MNRSIILLSSVALTLAPALVWSADQNSAAQPSATNVGTQNPYSSGDQAAQTPPADWTSLKGTVQMVDADAKTVQIKDDAGQLLQVPVERGVRIEKAGQNVRLSQIQMGDSITLSKSNAPSQGNPGMY